jgi:aryl-alcohol dehydrogenase-like predicted oxidoreductase
MVFADTRGAWGATPEDAREIFTAFAEAGGNFVDTANYYAQGNSEQVVGELINAERDRWVLSTKYTLNTRPGDPNAGGNHRKSMVQALHRSLARLGTDYIDVYWVHCRDEFTPIDEMVRALDDLVSSGKVLYAGISDTPAWQVSQAVTLADLRGWTRFAGLQVPYSLIERTVERDLLPMARSLELTVTAWSPLGDGLLTGRYGTGRPLPEGTRIAGVGASHRLTERNLAIADVVNDIAAARGASAAQVAIAWILAQQQRAAIIPIVGARTLAQFKDNLGALSVELSAAELDQLDEASRIELGFPHDFGGMALAYGQTYDLIDGRQR